MITSVLLILVGAIATGAIQLGFGIRDRRHEAETILTAIASEADSICRLIRHQNYLGSVAESAASVRNGTWDGRTIIIDIRENYFSVFEGLASKIGLLRPNDTAKIVNFYAYCKSVIDSTRPDGPHAEGEPNEYRAANILALEALLIAILNLGREIVQLPRVSIHDAISEGHQVQIGEDKK